MLRMQTVFAECPAKSKLKYLLRISLFDWSPEIYQVLIQQPGLETVECQVTDEAFSVERSDGPGVWRFNAIVRSRKNSDEVSDSLTIEAVIFPAVNTSAKAAVDSCIEAMNMVITGDGSVTQGNTDVTAEASTLYSQFGDTSILEILRRLAMNPQNQNHTIRCLSLLESNLNRSGAKWLIPFAMAVLSEIAGSANKYATIGSVQRLIKGANISSSEKWIYLMRLTQGTSLGGFGLGPIIYELERCTPQEYRNQTAASILELCSGQSGCRGEAAHLCISFEYAAAAPVIMDWLQTKTLNIDAAIKVFDMANYRESIPYLRKELSKPRHSSDVLNIMELLIQWKDIESLPVLISKLENIEEWGIERVIPELINAYGREIIPQLKEVQSLMSPQKTKKLSQILEKLSVG